MEHREKTVAPTPAQLYCTGPDAVACIFQGRRKEENIFLFA